LINSNDEKRDEDRNLDLKIFEYSACRSITVSPFQIGATALSGEVEALFANTRRLNESPKIKNVKRPMRRTNVSDEFTSLVLNYHLVIVFLPCFELQRSQRKMEIKKKNASLMFRLFLS
jgi:hypothetical protein